MQMHLTLQPVDQSCPSYLNLRVFFNGSSHAHTDQSGCTSKGSSGNLSTFSINWNNAMSDRTLSLDETLYQYLLDVSLREHPVLVELRAP
ncbi:hypothetical protein ACFOFO_06645 [Undibacterium arcticum]|uniref:Uncharacterized protein n=1 Tax=Undibacterium arcticum TaxID=1762892 RepID=A0ABV7F0F1_9BURK